MEAEAQCATAPADAACAEAPVRICAPLRRLVRASAHFAVQTAPLTPLRAADDAAEAVDEALVDVSLEDGENTPRVVRARASTPPQAARSAPRDLRALRCCRIARRTRRAERPPRRRA